MTVTPRVKSQVVVTMLLKQKKQQSSWLPLQQSQCMIPHRKSHFYLISSLSFPSKFLLGLSLSSKFHMFSSLVTGRHFFFSFCYHIHNDGQTQARLRDHLVKWLQLTFEPCSGSVAENKWGTSSRAPKQHHVGSQALGQLSPLNFIQSIAFTQMHI